MSVKALSRGLDVLAAVNELNPGAVKDVVETTGLPKATAIRLLKSLVEQGYLAEDENGHGYRVTSDVRKLSRALSTQTRYAQIANPVLRDFSMEVKFPCIFAIRDGASLLIEADSKKTSPMLLKLFDRTRLPLLQSASGLCVLAAMSDADARLLIERAVPAQGEEGGQRLDVESAANLVTKTRERGYGFVEYSDAPGLCALAMPVFEHGLPVGSVSVPYYREIVSEPTIASLFLPRLKHATDRISHALTTESPVPENDDTSDPKTRSIG